MKKFWLYVHVGQVYACSKCGNLFDNALLFCIIKNILLRHGVDPNVGPNLTHKIKDKFPKTLWMITCLTSSLRSYWLRRWFHFGVPKHPPKSEDKILYTRCVFHIHEKYMLNCSAEKNAVLWHNVACTTGWEACFAAQARLSNERLSTTAATTANHRPDEVTWALNHHFMNAWMDASADVCIDVYVHKYMCLYRCTSQT